MCEVATTETQRHEERNGAGRHPLLRSILFSVSLCLCGEAFAATVTNVQPSLGIIGGGTTVEITGTGFTGASAVTFGATPATTFTVVSATKINAGVPAHGVGTVSVDVTVGGVSSNPPANALFTYTTDNQNVQVTVTVTILAQANIQWGAATTADDAGTAHAAGAGTITPYVWIVKDPEFGALNQVSANTTYSSSGPSFPHTLAVSNVSTTNSPISIDASCSDAYSASFAWAAGFPASGNVFAMTGQLGASGAVTISPGPATLNPAPASYLIKGTDQNLVLQLTTPQTISPTTAGVSQTITVSLVATAH